VMHPDKGGSKEMFQALSTAFDILCDNKSRAEHDRYLRQSEPQQAPQSEPQQGPNATFGDSKRNREDSECSETCPETFAEFSDYAWEKISLYLRELSGNTRRLVFQKVFSEDQRCSLEAWMKQNHGSRRRCDSQQCTSRSDEQVVRRIRRMLTKLEQERARKARKPHEDTLARLREINAKCRHLLRKDTTMADLLKPQFGRRKNTTSESAKSSGV